jgi:TetR/AcrR family transcriptional repressor of nem operon
MFAISAMVGALALSRVLEDSTRSDEMLQSVSEQLIALNAPNVLGHSDSQD